MTKVETQLVCLTQEVADIYFRKRDYESLIFFLSDKISWIGTGNKEICLNKNEALDLFEKEKSLYTGPFEIKKEWYQCIQIQTEMVIVLATMNICTPEDSEYMIDMPLRISVVWNKDNNLWKIIHVHNSIPDANLLNHYYFNIDNAKSTYAMMNEKVKLAAITDSVTNIRNMEGFCEEVEYLLKENPNKKYALIKFGIRDFRYINQRFGYSVGDEVLQNIALNLNASCADIETCGRIEKDTFAMLYTYTNRKSLDCRMCMVRKNLLTSTMKKKIQGEIHFSAGIYLIHKNERDVKNMLDKALLAQLNVARQKQGSHFEYFQNFMLERQNRSSYIMEQARFGMQNNEFQLYIQPQFDINTKEVVSGEALTRWIDKDKNEIAPNEFIVLFERFGLIIEFDFYMLDKLCQTLRKWMNEGRRINPISINQSRLHIDEENYLDRFCKIVDRYEIPHHYLIFELTESAFVQHSQKMLTLSSQLHNLGFLLAIDDFGTGYSSLNLLSIVSADILKIDKSLLDEGEVNQRSKVILEKVIEMAHSMDMTVICEGIETMAQLEFLQKLHCDLGQGFLIGKPIRVTDFEKIWMKEKCR